MAQQPMANPRHQMREAARCMEDLDSFNAAQNDWPSLEETCVYIMRGTRWTITVEHQHGNVANFLV